MPIRNPIPPANCPLYISQEFGELHFIVMPNFVNAGFPSPAADYMESDINLSSILVPNPSSTFFVRVKGNSMIDANIFDGDVLIVDKSLKAQNDDIALCFIDGEFTVKRLKLTDGQFWLKPENPKFPAILIPSHADFRVWGVVSYIIHKSR
jgi:DNA polymerase V